MTVEGLAYTSRDTYARWTRDVIRYADTDRQGHVNNAVFSTFLETGRVDILYNPEMPLGARRCSVGDCASGARFPRRTPVAGRG